MKTVTLRCLSTALSPITHASGSVGNESVIAREPVTTPRGLMFIPFISGNALRHRAVREPGILWLIDQYGLSGELTLEQLNFLLHGGNLTQSTATENTKRIAEMHRCWPLLRLCGGSLPNQILSGSLDVWRGTLVCEENRHAISTMLGWFPEERLHSAERFISGYQYTRSDAAKTGIAQADDDRDSNLMIFSGQCVDRGAVFAHGFVLKHVSALELGALLWSLQLWQDTGGTIGGQAARGHGRLKCELLANGLDQQRLVSEYQAYATSVKADAVSWLNECWA